MGRLQFRRAGNCRARSRQTDLSHRPLPVRRRMLRRPRAPALGGALSLRKLQARNEFAVHHLHGLFELTGELDRDAPNHLSIVAGSRARLLRPLWLTDEFFIGAVAGRNSSLRFELRGSVRILPSGTRLCAGAAALGALERSSSPLRANAPRGAATRLASRARRCTVQSQGGRALLKRREPGSPPQTTRRNPVESSCPRFPRSICAASSDTPGPCPER